MQQVAPGLGQPIGGTGQINQSTGQSLQGPNQTGSGNGQLNQSTGKPADDLSQNTKPALGSSQSLGRPGQVGTGAVGRFDNTFATPSNANPQSGINQQLGTTFGRTLNNPSTLGPNARGGFFPTPPQASSGLKPNSGYGTPSGSRPSHMDANGIQRIN